MCDFHWFFDKSHLEPQYTINFSERLQLLVYQMLISSKMIVTNRNAFMEYTLKFGTVCKQNSWLGHENISRKIYSAYAHSAKVAYLPTAGVLLTTLVAPRSVLHKQAGENTDEFCQQNSR